MLPIECSILSGHLRLHWPFRSVASLRMIPKEHPVIDPAAHTRMQESGGEGPCRSITCHRARAGARPPRASQKLGLSRAGIGRILDLGSPFPQLFDPTRPPCALPARLRGGGSPRRGPARREPGASAGGRMVSEWLRPRFPRPYVHHEGRRSAPPEWPCGVLAVAPCWGTRLDWLAHR